jgi:hypothetical protein
VKINKKVNGKNKGNCQLKIYCEEGGIAMNVKGMISASTATSACYLPPWEPSKLLQSLDVTVGVGFKW